MKTSPYVHPRALQIWKPSSIDASFSFLTVGSTIFIDVQQILSGHHGHFRDSGASRLDTSIVRRPCPSLAWTHI